MTDTLKQIVKEVADSKSLKDILETATNPLKDVSVKTDSLPGGAAAQTLPTGEIIINEDVHDGKVDDFDSSRLIHELTHALKNPNYLDKPEERSAFKMQVQYLIEKGNSDQDIYNMLLPVFKEYKNEEESKQLLDEMIEEGKRALEAQLLSKLTKFSVLSPLTFTPEEKDIIDKVKLASEKLGIVTYLAGGIIRDKLLGKENEDMDFVTNQDSMKLAAYLAKAYKLSDPVHMDKSGATMIYMNGRHIDIIDAEKVFSRVTTRTSK